jgi:hypothetical protein
MLGDDTLKPPRATFLEQLVALLEGLGVQQAADRGTFDQMSQSALTVFEVDTT